MSKKMSKMSKKTQKLAEKIKNYNKKGKISTQQGRKLKKLGQNMRQAFYIQRKKARQRSDEFIDEQLEQRRILKEVEQGREAEETSEA